MAVTIGTAVVSKNGAVTTNTSLSVTLASTTINVVNVVEISGISSGTGINPVMATPSGWTKKFEQMSASGTPSVFVGVYCRAYQSGDSSSVSFTWTNQGQYIGVCTPLTGADTANPIPYFNSVAKSGSNTTYSITGTTGTDTGPLLWGAANKTGTGTAWSGFTDTQRATDAISTTSINTISLVTPSDVTGGTGYTKTINGPNTSIGTIWAFTAKAAAGTQFAGASVMTSASTMAAAGSIVNVGSTMASGSVMAADARNLSGRSAMVSASAMAIDARTPLQIWLSHTPLYVAHRGGENDFPEMTMFAYASSVANGARAINVDGWQSSDGVWVASHDQTTGRVCGTDLDIPTNTWATLSALRTTSGNQPICRVQDALAEYGNRFIVFAENKHSALLDTSWFNLLDAWSGPGHCVVKQFYTASTAATDGHARGYTTWGYYYEADVGNIASTQSRWDLLGMDYLASQSAWDSIKAVGKIVLGHVTPSAAAATTAFSKGADGVMTGKVLGVIPNDTISGAATAVSASSMAAVGGASLTGAATMVSGSAMTAQAFRTATAAMLSASAATAAATRFSPGLTVLNGSGVEVPAALYMWNGTVEVPVGMEVVS